MGSSAEAVESLLHDRPAMMCNKMFAITSLVVFTACAADLDDFHDDGRDEEDLDVAINGNRLWSVTEVPGRRMVFWVCTSEMQ